MRRTHGRIVAGLLALTMVATSLVVTPTTASATPTISAVGSLSSTFGTALTTLSDNPQNVGDVLVVFAHGGSSTNTVSGVSGGGVSTWTRAVSYAPSGSSDKEIWYGTVTSTGSSTITFSWSGSVTGLSLEYGVQEFSSSSGSSTIWGLDTTGTITNSSSSTVTFPSLTPAGSGELYYGYAVVANTGSAGSTSGYTYTVNSNGNIAAYDTSVSSATSPTASQSPSGTSGVVAALITATTSTLPSVSGVSPATGTTSGGTSVSISGTNFSAATAVKFGSTAATSYTVNSATSISATSPSESAGTVDITVTTSYGTSATVSADHFTFLVTISAVGSLATNAATGLTTLSVSPQHVGDLLALSVSDISASVTPTAVSGGGVATWTLDEGPYSDGPTYLAVFTGVVASTGSSTITVSFSGSVSSIWNEFNAQEFSSSAGSSTTWALDADGGATNGSSTTVTFPSLTPAGQAELYFGFAEVDNTGAAGSTSGFTYDVTTDDNVVAYDPSVSALVQPTASQSPAGTSGTVAVLMRASAYSYLAPSSVGEVYSVIGNGTAGSSGDNAQATEAELDSPISSAVDSWGNVYVADESNNRIQEIAGTTQTQWGIAMTAGDVYTIAGSSSGSSGHSGDGGAATSALLDGPSGVAVDSSGNLYIADQSNNRIQFVAAATCSSSCPFGLSTTADDIYTLAGSSSGSSGHSGDGGAATSALLDQPRNVALDTSGNLYIDDTSNNRVQFVAEATCSSSCPFGVGSVTQGDIYTIAGSSSGSSGHSGDSGAATSALLSSPKGLSFDSAGNLYLADAGNNRVQEVAATTDTQWGQSMTANDIYTVAGSSSGTSGSSGDGAAATSALLSGPRDVTLDSAGDLYVADGNNDRIQEVSASSGTQWGQSMTADDVYTIAGSPVGTAGSSDDGGPASAAFFSTPGGVTSDSAGDLYVTDEGNNKVREITTDAVVSANSADDVHSLGGTGTSGTAGDSGQSTEAQLDQPVSSVVDSSGNVYTADGTNNRVQEFAATTHSQWGISMTAGDVYTVAGNAAGTSGHSGDSGSATSALLDDPVALALDSSGDLLIADAGNNRVQLVAAATCSSGCPFGLGSTTANDIYTIAGSSSGSSGSSGDGGAATSALLNAPKGLALDSGGDLLIADTANNRVQLVAASTCSSSCPFGLGSTTADDVYTIAGSSSGTSGSSGDSGAATSALLSAPKGLALDGSGNLYIADSGNNRVQEVATSGGTQWSQSMVADDIYTVAGSSSGTSGHSGDGGAATSALLSGPAGVAFDAPGDLYIADTSNNRVQEVAAATTSQWGQSMTADDIYTVAGSSSGTSGSSGDGGAATSALFHTVSGLAVDGVGDLYVTDNANNEVREVVPAILAPTLPDEDAGGGNPAEFGYEPQTSVSTAQDQGLSVDDVTGTLSDSVTDLSVPGSGIPLDLTRTYDSARAGILGPFGYGWTDSYNLSIAAGTGSLSNTEQVTQENGSIAYFYQNEQGTWSAPAREFATLSYNSSNQTWTFTRRKTQIFIFNSSGQLTEETDPNGYETTLSYNATGELTTVTSYGEVGSPPGAPQSLLFSYGSNGLVSQVTDPLGRAVTYTYASDELTATTQAGPLVRVPGDLYDVLGDGFLGDWGDTGEADEAALDSPISSAVDAAGNIYVADQNNNRVQEVAATSHYQFGVSMTAGDVYTIAGSSSGTSGTSGDGGAATSALLDGPSGVALDSAGDLYISDQSNNRIQEIAAATGTQWGQSMTADDIYTVAGSSSGTSGHSGDGAAATSALLDGPRNLAFDASGNLYVSDTSNNRVQMIAAATCSSSCPFGLGSTTADDIYTVAGSSAGTSGSSGDGGAATSALLDAPKGVTIDASGNLYVADCNNNRIQEVPAATGTHWGISMTADDIYTVAGSSSGTSGSSGDGGAATSALLSAPRDVTVDAAGDLYIADGANNRVQEVAFSTGSQWGQAMTADDVYTVAGSSTGTSGSSGDGGAGASALFEVPGGIALDNVGDLFITDEGNDEVRELAATSEATTALTPSDIFDIAGNQSQGDSGDNGQANESEFNYPISSAVDPEGDVYVADESNNRVQELAGTTHTQWGIAMTAGDVYTIAGSSSGSSGS